MITDGRSNTSRLIVKQHEHATCPPATINVLGWKKFWVVFSNACREKFSQYITTLRSAQSWSASRWLGEQ